MGMKKECAQVVSQECLAENIYSMWLETGIAKNSRSGQFMLVYPNDASRLLGRPICICRVSDDKKELRIVYRAQGEGTRSFTALKPGDSVFIEGPLGNGYDISGVKGKEVLLIGGGIGAPSLLQLAADLKRADTGRITAVLGYRDSSLDNFLADEFKELCDDTVIATDDGSFGICGNVIDAVKSSDIRADVIFACGPMVMLKAVASLAHSQGAEAYISLEERMACGVGACLGCVVKTKETDSHSHVKNARICTEGPVFNASEVEL